MNVKVNPLDAVRLMLVGESKPSVEIAEKKLMFFGGSVPWCSLGGGSPDRRWVSGYICRLGAVSPLPAWVRPCEPVDYGGHTVVRLGLHYEARVVIHSAAGMMAGIFGCPSRNVGWVPLMWQRQLPLSQVFSVFDVMPSGLSLGRLQIRFSGVGASERSSRWTGLPRGLGHVL